MSLPENLLKEMDDMIAQRGFESRSQALASMISQQLTEYRCEYDDQIVAGTINLVYEHTVPGLQKQLAELQHIYIDEVISSLHVHLMQARTMEVILVQGPASRLKSIASKMSSCKGVLSGRLQLSTALMPQLHPLPSDEAASA